MTSTRRVVPPRGLTISLLAGIAVRLVWIAAVESKPVSDFAWYFNRALELSRGEGFLMNGHPTAYWPIGWPGTLAGYFLVAPSTVTAVKLLNVLLWAVTIALCYFLGERLGGPRTAMFAGLLVALWPDFVVYTGLVASENLAAPLIAASVLLLTLWTDSTGYTRSVPYAFGAGLALGYSILVRSTGVLLPLLVVPSMVVLKPRRARVTGVLAFLVGVALLPSVWIVRNVVVMDALVLSTNSGANLWIGANPEADGSYMAPSDADYSTVEAEVETSARLTREALVWVRENTGQWIALMPQKARHLFGDPNALGWALTEVTPEESYEWRQVTGFERVLVGGYRLLRFDRHFYQSLLWITGALGLALGLRQHKVVAVWISVFVGYWVLFHLVFAFGSPRFLVSVAPLVCVAASHALVRSADQLRRRAPGEVAQARPAA